MIFGRVFSSRGLLRVPITLSVQRSGLPQFILQGYPGNVRRFRQCILSALSQAQWRLPRGRVVVDCGIPVGQKVWGESGLGLAVVLSLLEHDAVTTSTEKEGVGAIQIDGSITLPDECVALLAGESDKELLSAPPPTQAVSFLRRDNWKVVSSVQSLVAGDLKLSRDITLSPSETEYSVPSCSLDPQHLLVLALVWAGGHSLLLFGSPGEGKTLSREWFVALAPDLSQEQERARLCLSGGLFNSARAGVCVPAATDSLQKWLVPRSGWLRQATHGSIWLDELPLVPAAVRTRFRAWIEGTDAHTQELVSQGWQASFVSTMNPCPCGFWGESRCVCRRSQVQQVLQKVSWPLLDRFALQYRVEWSEEMRSTQLERKGLVESLRSQIMLARTRQMERSQKLNSQATLFDLPHDFLRKYPVWRQRVGAWSPRRQVQYLQVVQTLLDGEWATTPQEACETAWRLCQGTESLRAR